MKPKKATMAGITLTGPTVKVAKLNLEERIRTHLERYQAPSVYRWEGITGVLWSELSTDGNSLWFYHLVYDREYPSQSNGQCRLWHSMMGSREQAERSMRLHAAQAHYDQSTQRADIRMVVEMGIILNEDDRHSHGRWVAWQERFKALAETGMERHAIEEQLRTEGL